ncbi:pectate lyase [Kribbella voronezhensis]|uniref:Pectate lyase n=1 Tax=Kribbella voronezhensis TaxID=2512212 RepID=A0A4R7SUZ7_9ACTN|nr:right-handed parallel beta-helix repeat-containing protein [Kribbella voronezhensis]TDU83112.1 pectate lyase [Kribbella voronezhensis]
MTSSAPTTVPPRRRILRATAMLTAGAALLASSSVAFVPEASAYTFALQGWATQGGGTTGGGSASPVTVTTQAALISNVQASGARVIKVSGTIALPSGMTKVAANKTIIGVGSSATITTGGFNIASVSNVIIRNINFKNWTDDAINVQYSTRVWIDHNNFSNGYDGAVDIKRASDYVTVSWNRVFSHDKSFLLGHSDDNGAEDLGKLRVTYHHNYFDGSTQRHPRVRFANPVHVYNNYYRGNSGYGVASTVNAGVFVQRNYFENVSKPTVAQTGDSPAGNLKLDGNYLTGSGTPVSRNPGSVAAIPYSYTLDAAADIKSIVTAYAGTGKI